MFLAWLFWTTILPFMLLNRWDDRYEPMQLAFICWSEFSQNFAWTGLKPQSSQSPMPQ
jgi:hypothetical protein